MADAATTGHPIARQPLVVDSSVNCAGAAPALAARGIKVVMRYYSRPGYPNTILSAAEAAAIHKSGMAIGVVYQFNSGKIESFDHASAKAAADACMKRDAGLNPGKPETIRHPQGAAIYFGVDNDLTGGSDAADNAPIILDYFRVIGQEFKDKGAPFSIGVYGSGDVCERVVGAGLATYGWLAGFSTGWTRMREVYNETGTPHWHLFQNALEVPLEVAVDTDILNPRAGGVIGAFDKDGLIGPLDDAAIRSTLRFVKAPSGAMLFASPGTDPIDKVGHNRMVTLLKPDAKWSKVETTFHYGNSGSTRQGFMDTSLLGGINSMT